MTDNYLEINKKSWDGRLDAHFKSDFYDVDGFINGNTSLNKIELDLLGDIQGKSVLHLQCHFGQDTISLSRMGAKVVGVDFSERTIEKAKELAKITDSDAQFICSDVYQLPAILNQTFDIVFTSYGTISWLPDLSKWSKVVEQFLKPNGRFVFAEFHPAVWMYDDDLEKVTYYYNNVEPIVEEESGTYADKDAPIKEKCICWNHGVGEVVSALINSGLNLNQLQEFCYAPYPFVKNCEQYAPEKYRIKHFGDKFPLVYALTASKNL